MPGGFDGVGVGSRRQRDRDERVARRGVVGEPATAERHVDVDALRRRRLRGSPAAAAAATIPSSASAVATVASAVDGVVHRAPAGAPAQVRGERAVERRAGAVAAARMTMPGVQNPHCDPPVATNAHANRSRTSGVEALDRRDRPALDARRGGDARDPGVAVDQHGATAALALRRAAVLHRHQPEPLAQHREQRLARLDVDLDGRGRCR